jgi:hypothetical protein
MNNITKIQKIMEEFHVESLRMHFIFIFFNVI